MNKEQATDSTRLDAVQQRAASNHQPPATSQTITVVFWINFFCFSGCKGTPIIGTQRPALYGQETNSMV